MKRLKISAFLFTALAVGAAAGVALADEAFHPCVVRGKTQPGAWVVSNCGQIAQADEKVTPEEVDTDAWYDELKQLLKDAS